MADGNVAAVPCGYLLKNLKRGYNAQIFQKVVRHVQRTRDVGIEFDRYAHTRCGVSCNPWCLPRLYRRSLLRRRKVKRPFYFGRSASH